ncbi:uncharacterized protein LOC120851119 [Ixodes scapularis]|uniref:uncharacterized protein LOC120851119 n=1 Tax=Ixodes scapularis TaxID=6945 RepID=UPI001A9CC4AC|nr:uncharacterized protein LOC120851119 [Ixodes scapularis]
MTGCSVTKCKYGADSGKSFCRIPTAGHDVRRRLVWLFRMKRKSPTPKNARVCEDHFESKEFQTYRVNGRRKMKPNAVPSLLLSPSCHPATDEQSADIASQVDVHSAIMSESVVPQIAADIASPVDVHSAIVSESVVPESETSFCATTLRDVLFDIITRSEKIGIEVDAIVTDNAAWKSGHMEVVWRNGNEAWEIERLMPSSMQQGTTPVSLEDVTKMCVLDKKHKLKLLPNLKLKDENPNHFEKEMIMASERNPKLQVVPHM